FLPRPPRVVGAGLRRGAAAPGRRRVLRRRRPGAGGPRGRRAPAAGCGHAVGAGRTPDGGTAGRAGGLRRLRGARVRLTPESLILEVFAMKVSAEWIDERVLIPDLLQAAPQVRPVLDRYGLRGCGGPKGPVESLGYFAKAHDVPLPILLDELRGAAARPPARAGRRRSVRHPEPGSTNH